MVVLLCICVQALYIAASSAVQTQPAPFSPSSHTRQATPPDDGEIERTAAAAAAASSCQVTPCLPSPRTPFSSPNCLVAISGGGIYRHADLGWSPVSGVDSLAIIMAGVGIALFCRGGSRGGLVESCGSEGWSRCRRQGLTPSCALLSLP